VEFTASKKTYTFKVAGVGVKAIETSSGSEKLGNDQVNQRQFTLSLMGKDLFYMLWNVLEYCV